MLVQLFKCWAEVCQVGLQGGAGDKHVNKISECKGEPLQNVIHEALEGLASILEAEWHLQELPKAEWGGVGHFGDIRGISRGFW